MEPERYRMRAIFSSVTIALVSIPLILGMVPPNSLYGFRSAFARPSPDIWYAVNAFAGWALLVAAVVSTIGLAKLPPTAKRWRIWATLSVPILAAVAASFLYLERFR